MRGGFCEAKFEILLQIVMLVERFTIKRLMRCIEDAMMITEELKI
jgi:hypothetical protein